jgi:hypothetical protein
MGGQTKRVRIKPVAPDLPRTPHRQDPQEEAQGDGTGKDEEIKKEKA